MSAAPLPPLSTARPSLEVERPLRVAVVGAGVMGKRHARVLASRAERFELVAVMDVDLDAASELARAYGVEAAAREGDAIERADAVVVATPIFAHALSVRRALASGRHVLVEKPVARTAEDAGELVVQAAASGAQLFVGHSERFNPVVRALARMVEPGSIERISLHRAGNARSRAGGEEGALINLGVHDFDLAAYLARSPLILAHTTTVPSIANAPGANAAEERADVTARTESGAKVHILVDQRPADGMRRRAITLTTAAHVWAGDLLGPTLVRTCRATGARDAIPLDTEEPLLAQALAFFAALRGGPGAREIATGHDGMSALLVAERARAASLPPRPWGKLGVPRRF